MYSSTYVYALWPQSFYVAIRVVFQSLKYSWQTAPYTSTTIATLSTKGTYFFFDFHFELTPFSDGQLSTVSARPTVFNWEKYWVRIYTAVVYITRGRTTGIWGHHEGNELCIFPKDGEWGHTNTTIIATWGHEQIISNGYEDIMRDNMSERREMRANEEHNLCITRTWNNHFNLFNSPHHTSHPVYCLFCEIS